MRGILLWNALLFISIGCSTPTPPPSDTSWNIVALPLPTGATKPWIDVIRGSGPNNIWLICTANQNRISKRLTFHFDGEQWTLKKKIPLQHPRNIYPLSENDVWIIGNNGGMAHFDGAQWTPHHYNGFYHDFVDLYVHNKNDIWIFNKFVVF